MPKKSKKKDQKEQKRTSKDKGGDSMTQSSDHDDISSDIAAADDDDALSDSGSLSIHSEELQQQISEEGHEDTLKQAAENLKEKSSNIRYAALKKVIYILQHYDTEDVLSNYLDTISEGAIHCSQKGTEKKEKPLALQVFSLLSGIVGGSMSADQRASLSMTQGKHLGTLCLDEEYAKKMKEIAKRFADLPASQQVTQSLLTCNAIFHLGILLFIDEEPEDLLGEDGIMNHFVDVYWHYTSEDVQAQAIETWTLLASIVPPHLQYSILLPNVRHILKSKLENTHHTKLRIAIGRALALLYETVHVHNAIEEEREHEEYEEILDLMEEIASISTKTVSKKDKSSQRSAFRDFIATVDNGEAPYMKLNVAGHTIEFNTWQQIIQYDHFKKLFAGGLDQQLKQNSLLQDIFQLGELNLSEEASNKKIDPEYKRLYLSKSSEYSKMETVEKKKATRNKMMIGEE